jgi:hypothetical protein
MVDPNVPLLTLVVASFQADGRRFDKGNSAMLARSTCHSPRVWQPSFSSSRIPESFFVNEIICFRVDLYGFATEDLFMESTEKSISVVSRVTDLLKKHLEQAPLVVGHGREHQCSCCSSTLLAFFRLKAPHRLPYSTHCMPLQSLGQDQGMHTDGVNIFGRFNVPSSNNATDGMTRKDGPTLTNSC